MDKILANGERLIKKIDLKMKAIIQKIIDKQSLTSDEAKAIIYSISEESLNEAEIVAIMIAIQTKGISIDELDGFREALLELSLPISLNASEAIDVCGTGGDGKDTFNISTTSSFVLASMGFKVIKHGNYGVSSSCGSSNVLEELGIQFTSNEKELEISLKNKNICFLHAPLFHPTLKKVAHIRKQLAMKTFFNSIGPLVNPVQPKFQLSGTYSLELAKIYQHILKKSRNAYRVVYGMDGFDEVTFTNQTRVLGDHSDYMIDASQFGLKPIQLTDLKAGNTIKKSASIVKEILKGKGSKAQNQVVAINTALAMNCFLPKESIQTLYQEALTFVGSGQTAKTFKF